MKVFLDANILFTGAYSEKNKITLLYEFSSDFKYQLITSNYALTEAQRNLEIKRPEGIERLNAQLKLIHLVSTIHTQGCPIDLPTKDQPIFLAALHLKCTHLITGDKKDFGPLMNSPQKTSGVIIQTVSEFLNAL